MFLPPTNQIPRVKFWLWRNKWQRDWIGALKRLNCLSQRSLADQHYSLWCSSLLANEKTSGIQGRLAVSRHSKSNPIELNFNRTQSNSIELNRWIGLSSAIERYRTHRKEKKWIEPNRAFDFRTRDLCKTDVENPLPDLRSSSYFSPECSALVFRKRRNSTEMASDALWIVSIKCIVRNAALLTSRMAKFSGF